MRCCATDSNQKKKVRLGKHEKHFQWGKQKNNMCNLQMCKMNNSL